MLCCPLSDTWPAAPAACPGIFVPFLVRSRRCFRMRPPTVSPAVPLCGFRTRFLARFLARSLAASPAFSPAFSSAFFPAFSPAAPGADCFRFVWHRQSADDPVGRPVPVVGSVPVSTIGPMYRRPGFAFRIPDAGRAPAPADGGAGISPNAGQSFSQSSWNCSEPVFLAKIRCRVYVAASSSVSSRDHSTRLVRSAPGPLQCHSP